MTSDDDKQAYRIGYGKPPQHSQFQKGLSGNKRGRPKGSKNIATALHDELNRRIPVTENGARRTITKREAVVKQVVNNAASGDSKAMRTLFQISKDLGDFKLPPHQKKTIITFTFAKPLPGEDRSYRDDTVLTPVKRNDTD